MFFLRLLLTGDDVRRGFAVLRKGCAPPCRSKGTEIPAGGGCYGKKTFHAFACFVSTTVIVNCPTSTVHPCGVSAPCDAARLSRSRTVCFSVIFFALNNCAFFTGQPNSINPACAF